MQAKSFLFLFIATTVRPNAKAHLDFAAKIDALLLAKVHI